MKSISTRFGRIAACAALALAAGGLAACGDSDDPQELSFEVSTQGKGTTITAPESAEPGLAEITLANESDADADLQLIRIEGEHSADEVAEGFGAAVRGEAFPDWLFAAGGVGGTGPGETRVVSQILQPGTYYAFNTESRAAPTPETAASTEVSGDSSDEELGAADATVEAGEYLFKAETLPAGTSEIVLDNVGVQPHHLIASRLIGDGTAADVERFFKTESGKPPLSEKGTQATAVVEGGESQIVTLDLEPGRYALYCFITDRQGGPPHAFKGMIDEVEVE